MVVYQNDHIGTPQKITAVNGAIVWAAKYDSFGKATIDASSTVENNLRFAGQYEDSETGLHYNWYRYYDSLIGRYLKVDPIGMGGGVNHFTYVGNNSVKWIDPYGLQAVRPVPWGLPLYYPATKRDRKYGKKPISVDYERPRPRNSCDCDGLETCDQLRARGFIYTSAEMAFQAAAKALIRPIIHHTNLPKHKIYDPQLTYHENIRWKDDPSGKKYGQPATIIGAQCCENGKPPVKTLYNWVISRK